MNSEREKKNSLFEEVATLESAEPSGVLEGFVAPATKGEIEQHRRSVLDMERELTEVLERLRASDCLKLIGDKTLSEFWDCSAVAAPFEQQLTLKQISQIKVSALLEKRSINPSKVEAMIAAIERALSGGLPAKQGSPSCSNESSSSNEPIMDRGVRKVVPLLSYFMCSGVSRAALILAGQVTVFLVSLLLSFALVNYIASIDLKNVVLWRNGPTVVERILLATTFFLCALVSSGVATKYSLVGRTERSVLFAAALIVVLSIFGLVYQYDLGWLAIFVGALFFGSFYGYRLAFRLKGARE